MNSLDEYVNIFVKIDKQEDNTYGYHPFNMFVENKEGQTSIICLLGHDGIEQCYLLFLKYVLEESKKIYMAVDFPNMGDINNDFVGVFSYSRTDSNTEFDLVALPYNKSDGSFCERVKVSITLTQIIRDFKNVLTRGYYKKDVL